MKTTLLLIVSFIFLVMTACNSEKKESNPDEGCLGKYYGPEKCKKIFTQTGRKGEN